MLIHDITCYSELLTLGKMLARACHALGRRGWENLVSGCDTLLIRCNALHAAIRRKESLTALRRCANGSVREPYTCSKKP